MGFFKESWSGSWRKHCPYSRKWSVEPFLQAGDNYSWANQPTWLRDVGSHSRELTSSNADRCCFKLVYPRSCGWGFGPIFISVDRIGMSTFYLCRHSTWATLRYIPLWDSGTPPNYLSYTKYLMLVVIYVILFVPDILSYLTYTQKCTKFNPYYMSVVYNRTLLRVVTWAQHPSCAGSWFVDKVVTLVQSAPRHTA